MQIASGRTVPPWSKAIFYPIVIDRGKYSRFRDRRNVKRYAMSTHSVEAPGDPGHLQTDVTAIEGNRKSNGTPSHDAYANAGAS